MSELQETQNAPIFEIQAQLRQLFDLQESASRIDAEFESDLSQTAKQTSSQIVELSERMYGLERALEERHREMTAQVAQLSDQFANILSQPRIASSDDP